MYLFLLRLSKGKGILYLCIGTWKYRLCDTLENPSSLLPCDDYKLELTYSPKFRRYLPLLSSDDIDASRGFRIHSGNYLSDSRGCILVGLANEDVSLRYSKITLNFVLDLIKTTKLTKLVIRHG